MNPGKSSGNLHPCNATRHLLTWLIAVGACLAMGAANAQGVPFGDPPTIDKAFGVASLRVGETTTVTFNLAATASECGQDPRYGAAFTDALPAGLVVAATPGVVDTCNGDIVAVPGSSTISMTDGVIDLITGCSVTVNVTGSTPGIKNNSVQVTSAEECWEPGDPVDFILTGNTASAALNVIGPPTLAKAFGAESIVLNASTGLTFTLGNPAQNPVALANIAFTDTLPAGLVVASPNGLANTCGGSVSAVPGSASVAVSGVGLASGATCTVTLNVTGTSVGTKNNVSAAVQSSNGGTGNAATASINVLAPVATDIPTLGGMGLALLALCLAALAAWGKHRGWPI